MDTKALTEKGTGSTVISSAVYAAGWDAIRQIRGEVQVTNPRLPSGSKHDSSSLHPASDVVSPPRNIDPDTQ